MGRGLQDRAVWLVRGRHENAAGPTALRGKGEGSQQEASLGAPCGKKKRAAGLGLRWPGSWASTAGPAMAWAAAFCCVVESLGQARPKFGL